MMSSDIATLSLPRVLLVETQVGNAQSPYSTVVRDLTRAGSGSGGAMS